MRVLFTSLLLSLQMSSVWAEGTYIGPDGRALPPAAADEKTEVFASVEAIAQVEAWPKEIKLTGKNDSVQVVLVATMKDGTKADVTRLAKGADAEVAKWVKVDAFGQVIPVTDGTGTLKLCVGTQCVALPFTVVGMQTEVKPDYVRDVMPVVSKMGCNQGTCHGSKEGKNGFKLSLRGYDPLFDVRAWTDDVSGRRVNTAFPDSSLMLLKGTGAVAHEGQQLMTETSKYYGILRQWIANGAQVNMNSPKVTKIEVQPQNPVVEAIGGRQQMRIVATYADQSVRDVTNEAFIESGNTEVVRADKKGLVSTLRRGEAPILARFEGAYAATTVTVMGDRTGFVWQDLPANNEVDRFVSAKLKRTKTSASALCTDLDFIRRIYLDLTGLPPTPDQIRAFLVDPRDSRWKRDLLIDQLISSEDYVEHWTNKWADLLQVNSKFLGREGAEAFRKWLREHVAKNTPYDQFAREILTATGSNKDNPAASYFKILRQPEETMENTTHLWLATRFNCNKCHDHPFERWTQDQYYQMTAFFAQTGLERDPASGDRNLGGTAVEGAKPLFEKVVDLKQGETKHQRTNKVTSPEFPYSAKFEESKEATRRQRLAAWITSADNQYFAKSCVNRLWGYLTGTGIIEPLDDIRAGNPPSNPELLDWLTKEFIQSGFDQRHIIRLICKSRTYQLSVQSDRWNEDDTVNFSHAKARRLPAEVLFDTIYASAGAKSRFPGMPEGTRAAALADPEIKTPDGFLANLGKPVRESACECERSGELQLGPVMALISGPTVGDAISAADNAIAKLTETISDDRELVDELFLRFLGRPSTESEAKASLEMMSSLEAQSQELQGMLSAYETELKPKTEAAEAERQKLIAATKEEKSRYEAESADRWAQEAKAREEKVAAATVALNQADQALAPRLAEWETKQKGQIGWSTLEPRTMTSSYNKTVFKEEADNAIYVTGPDQKQTYTVTAEMALESLSGLRLEALADDRIPGKGPGRSGQGNFVLSEIEASWQPLFSTDWKPITQWSFDSGVGEWAAEETCEISTRQGALVTKIKPNTRKSGISVPVKAPAGDYVLLMEVKGASVKQSLFWTTEKDFVSAPIRSVSSDLSTRQNEQFSTVRFAFTCDSPLTGLRLQTDAANVTFQAKNIRLFSGKMPASQPIKFNNAFATFAQGGYDPKSAINGKSGGEPDGWAIYPEGIAKTQTAVFTCQEKDQPLLLSKGGGILTVMLKQDYPDGKHSIGRFRLSATNASGALNFGLPREITNILAINNDTRSENQRKALLDFYRGQDQDYLANKAALTEASKPLPPDAKLEEIKARLVKAEQPLPIDPKLAQLRKDVDLSRSHLANRRLIGAQDVAWALINNPAFLFNR